MQVQFSLLLNGLEIASDCFKRLGTELLVRLCTVLTKLIFAIKLYFH